MELNQILELVRAGYTKEEISNMMKPEEAKPEEVKPEETKPEETKPDETKPDETKPDVVNTLSDELVTKFTNAVEKLTSTIQASNLLHSEMTGEVTDISKEAEKALETIINPFGKGD